MFTVAPLFLNVLLINVPVQIKNALVNEHSLAVKSWSSISERKLEQNL